jgi:uncharacterized protein YbaP (TraB family)
MMKCQIAVTTLIILSMLLLVLVSACGATKSVEPTPVVEPTPDEGAETSPAVDIEPTPTPPLETPPSVDAEPESPPSSDDDTKGKSFIWQISSDTSTVYLLGSIHVASAGIYPLDSTIEDAFQLTDYLVVEVNTKEVDAVESAELLIEYGSYTAGGSLQDNLSEDLYVKLEAQLAQQGLNIAELDMFRPWVVYSLLEQLQMQELGYASEYGIDLYFMEKAAQADKAIIELETAEYQFELMSSLLDETIVLLLEEDITEPVTEDDLDMLFEAWENGDAAEMESLVFESLTEEPALALFYDKAYEERNISWVEKIEEFLADEETYFVVVGAGHLVGENGLINILDERGYVTEQLYDSD